MQTTILEDIPAEVRAREATGANDVLLLGATFSTGNMGVGALTAGAMTIAAHAAPQARLSFLDYGRESTTSTLEISGRVIAAPLVNLRFSWKLLLPNNIVLLLGLAWLARMLGPTMGKAVVKRNRWLAAIDRADLALALSGGDSFSDIYGLGRFFYVTLPQLLVVLMGKKLVLLPQTIGPFRGTPAKLMARWLLRRATLVYSRDLDGVRHARELLGVGEGEDAKVRFCNDVGFAVEPHVPTAAELEGLGGIGVSRIRPLVGVNVSGLLSIGGYTRRNMFGLALDYTALMEESIRMLIEDKGADVLLVPHVFGNSSESDVAAVAEFDRQLGARFPGRLFCVQGRYDQNEIKHVIGRCDFFIGARMHACIAALSQCIPAIGIAYSDKFTGVFDSVGVAELIVDPRKGSIAVALAQIGGAFDRRAVLATRLAEVIPVVKARVFGLLTEVA